MNTLEVLNKLDKDPSKEFKMINYKELRGRHDEIIADTIMSLIGKICYKDIVKRCPAVTLTGAFMELALWEEVRPQVSARDAINALLFEGKDIYVVRNDSDKPSIGYSIPTDSDVSQVIVSFDIDDLKYGKWYIK